MFKSRCTLLQRRGSLPQTVQVQGQQQLQRALATALTAMALTESFCPLQYPVLLCQNKQALLLHLLLGGACDSLSQQTTAAAAAVQATGQEAAYEPVLEAACPADCPADCSATAACALSALVQFVLVDRTSLQPAPAAAAVTADADQTLGAAQLACGVHAGFQNRAAAVVAPASSLTSAVHALHAVPAHPAVHDLACADWTQPAVAQSEQGWP